MVRNPSAPVSLSRSAGATSSPPHLGKRRLRVVIVGGGMISAVHRRSALLAGAELIGVLGSRPERSADLAEQWHVATAFSDVEEVAASAADVVHVCSPNASHAPYVETLLAAGKHVVCEKPLGISLDEAERMTGSGRADGVVATVPFVYRYHPVVREIRARAQAGEFGAWNLLHGQYLQDWLLSAHASNWRVDPNQGGASRAFADIGSHWCDLVEWVSGQRLTSVAAQLSVAVTASASARPGLPSGPEAMVSEFRSRPRTSATVMFRTADGVPGSVVVSQVAAGRKNRLWFELDGSTGSAAFDQEQPESFWLGPSDGSRSVVRDPQFGLGRATTTQLPAGRSRAGLRRRFAAFVADTYAAIDGDIPDGLPSFADGLRSARIVDAVVRSSRVSTWTEV